MPYPRRTSASSTPIQSKVPYNDHVLVLRDLGLVQLLLGLALHEVLLLPDASLKRLSFLIRGFQLLLEVSELRLVLLLPQLHAGLEGLELAAEVVNLVLNVRIKPLFLLDGLPHLENLQVPLLELLLVVADELLELLVLALNVGRVALIVGGLAFEALEL